MADEVVSGGKSTGVEPVPFQGSAISYNSYGVGYDALADCSGAATRGVRIEKKPAHTAGKSARTNSPDPPPILRPEARDALRRYWVRAQGKVGQMIVAAKATDFMELGVAGRDLHDILDDMWRLRDGREVEWVTILNFLQGVLKSPEVDALTAEQCEGILAIITQYLSPATVDKDDVRACLKIFRKVGFDPWAPISGDAEQPHDDKQQ